MSRRISITLSIVAALVVIGLLPPTRAQSDPVAAATTTREIVVTATASVTIQSNRFLINAKMSIPASDFAKASTKGREVMADVGKALAELGVEKKAVVWSHPTLEMERGGSFSSEKPAYMQRIEIAVREDGAVPPIHLMLKRKGFAMVHVTQESDEVEQARRAAMREAARLARERGADVAGAEGAELGALLKLAVSHVEPDREKNWVYNPYYPDSKGADEFGRLEVRSHVTATYELLGAAAH